MSGENFSIPSIQISETFTAPRWAIQEREIIATLNEAAKEFVAKYTRVDGTLIWRSTFEGMDGSDDPYEAFMNLALFYSMGGSEEVYELARKMWDSITLQWTEYGQIFREFDAYYDWMHHGEAYLYHYFFGLTKPESLIDRQRASRFAGMYTGKDEVAKNYDPQLKLITSPLTGSRGPRHVVTHEDWFTVRTVLDDYLAPYEDIEGNDFSTMLCNWSDPKIYDQLIEKMNQRMNRGDVPLNLNATSLITHAYMYNQDEELRTWVVEYLDAWRQRTKANNGIIPDNVGLSGVIGEYNDGKWWGGYYGWRWPHGFATIMEPLTNASMNAVLLTGDVTQLDLARSQHDLVWSMRKEEDGVVKVPHRHFDAGWADYRIPLPGNLIYLWTTSMADEDLERIKLIPRQTDWNEITIPGVSGKDSKTGKSTKHYIANTLPWFQFMQGELPSYPEDILEANLKLIDNQLKKMRSTTGDPLGWDDYDPATAEFDIGIDLTIDGYQIHAWQEFNPVYFEGLAQMLTGAPMHISHGGLQHGKIRLFDGQKKRPGLPEDVGVIVDVISSTSVSLQAVNLNSVEARQLVIQAGAFGENQFTSAVVITQSGRIETYAVNNKHVALDLEAGSGARITLTMDRYVNKPSYETPWQKMKDWAPIITGRSSPNLN